MPSFRGELTEGFSSNKYSCTQISGLPVELRTKEWNKLLEFYNSYKKLSDSQKAIFLRLLCKLCFYKEVTSIEKGYSDPVNKFQFEVNYWLLIANYVQFSDAGVGKYKISMFADLNKKITGNCLVKVNAIYQMVVQSVKEHNDLEAAIFWQDKHTVALKNIKEEIEPFVYKQLLSRYHRVGGFIPQMKNDPASCFDEMQSAEDVARDLINSKSNNGKLNFIYKICAKEMLFPVLESRIKEALWIKDFVLACERAHELQKLSPSDPRVYLHLGECLLMNNKIDDALLAYEKSIFFGVSNIEVSYFMLGQCYEKLGDIFRAQNAYKQSIEKDPEGISSFEALSELSKSSNEESKIIASWIESNKHIDI